MGDYAKFTFNSIAARADRKERENIFGRFLHNGDTIARALREKNIFRSPSYRERERENMDFQSISNFLVQRLGRERESRTIRAREGVISVVAARSSSPFLFCTSFSPNCFFYPSFLLIPDNARARFPLRLAHIKRQQCLNPFIIFPLPRVLSISPSSSSSSSKPRLRSWGPRPSGLSRVCALRHSRV